MSPRRFKPITTTPGLAELFRPRVFAGSEPDTLTECCVAHWASHGLWTVMLSPKQGHSGTWLAKGFEAAATQFYVELLALRRVTRRTPIRWLQHWPAREGAPWPFSADQFENVQLCLETNWLKTQARQLLTAADALRDSPLSVQLGYAVVHAHEAAPDR